MFRKSRNKTNSLYFIVSEALLLNNFTIVFLTAAAVL